MTEVVNVVPAAVQSAQLAYTGSPCRWPSLEASYATALQRQVANPQRYSAKCAGTALQRQVRTPQRYSAKPANHSATALQRHSATALQRYSAVAR